MKSDRILQSNSRTHSALSVRLPSVYKEFQTDDAIAKKVSIREIEKNNFSLNITLYIQALTNAAEESATPKSIQECYAEWSEHSLNMRRNYDALNELLKGGMENEQIQV